MRPRTIVLGTLLIGPGCGDFAGTAGLGPRTAATPGPVGVSIDAVAGEGSAGLRADRVLVAPVVPGTLPEIAVDHDSAVVSAPKGSAYGALAVPDNTDPSDFLEALLSDPRVSGTVRESWFRGASHWSADQLTDATRQHLDLTGALAAPPPGIADIVVAVLDSGVALAGDAGGAGPVAASLGGSAIHSPWDFIDGDAWPQDEHQHGTHIASLIAADGEARGMAPGVGLMPLRVLDAHNAGTELDLVEALYFAVDGGADVINLSLSFWPDYAPTPVLQEALTYAHSAGVLVVAATGNQGLDVVSWPAASPVTLAVGSFCMDTGGDWRVAPYSNHGLEVDVLAPGGCLDLDANEDGLADGVVGETIVPGTADQTGLYLWAGTSQAAAVVSGAAARLMALGLDATEARDLLLTTAEADVRPATQDRTALQAHLDGGLGMGRVQVGVAEAQSLSILNSAPTYLGAVLPFFELAADGPHAAALATVVDPTLGTGVSGVTAMVELVADSGETTTLSCTTTASGTCRVRASAATQGDTLASWTVSLPAVLTPAPETTSGAHLSRPGMFTMAVEGLSALIDGAEAAGQDPGLLGFQWSEGTDPVLGAVGEGWSFIDLRAGFVSTPSGTLLTPATMDALAEVSASSIDVNGDQSSILEYRFDGSGLSSSPLGHNGLPGMALGVDGLVDGAFGFHPTDSQTVEGSGLSSSPLGYTSGPVDLNTGHMLDGTEVDGALGDKLNQGGWRSAGGLDAPSALQSAGAGDQRIVVVARDAGIGPAQEVSQ